jgi:cation/acetate symporter
MLIATVLLAGWLAARDPAAVAPWAGASLSIAASGIFPVLILAIWWRRCTRLGALSGMISGVGLAMFYFAVVEIAGERPWSLFGLPDTAVPGFAAAAFGLPVAFFVAILVSLATPREAERDAALDSLRRPGAASLPQDDD